MFFVPPPLTPKSSGNTRDEVEAADVGFELTIEEEEGREGRRPRLALTQTPGLPLIGGSPCTGEI